MTPFVIVTSNWTGYELSIAADLQHTPDDEFIPFRRSDAVLSPSNAHEASPMSREHTQAALARETYYKTMQPAQYGVHMHNIRDAHQSKSHQNTTSFHSKVYFVACAVCAHGTLVVVTPQYLLQPHGVMGHTQ